MKLYIKELDKHPDNNYKLTYATDNSAGIDISINEQVSLLPNAKKKVGTGIAIQMPKNMVALLVPRSSAANVDVALANTVGIIDSDYRNEILIYMKNLSGSQQIFYPGEFYFQLVFVEKQKLEVEYVTELPEPETERKGGFGSTNKKDK